MKRKSLQLLFYFVLIGFIPSLSIGQKKSKEDIDPILRASPKLVVGIIVDQMRYDYITRFWNHFEEGGFKRLVNQGFNCKNNHFNYAPTSTGPGHASVYTGTTPATHGVIGNDWYDKELNKSVYCAADDDYNSVGTPTEAGKMSPHRMQTTTITDELRLHTQMRGKTIAISLKDRGAVLPGGHTANAAYWFQGKDEGNWITSSYYMSELPKWVQDFNATRSVDQYKKPWTTLKNLNTYLESGSDNNAYEGLFDGESIPVFPHDLPNLWEANSKYDLLKSTAFGNNLVADFAIAALEAESLGSDSNTDFLAISFSSTDYVGHMFGVNSKEVQDTYIRLDQSLAQLFKVIDKRVGEGEYTVFLTADHAAIDVPAYLKDQKIPAGYIDGKEMKSKMEEFLKYTYGSAELIKNSSNNQLFLDQAVLKNLDMNSAEVEETIAKELLSYPNVDRVYTGHQMWQYEYTEGIPHILQNGYNQKRSGDILWVMRPGFIGYSRTGSTHGSPYIYDTHSPLLFYGKGIKKGSTTARTEIPDIAPTIASLLGIAFPNGTTGRPISEVLE